jgi:NADH-quinone oxidoreductase subunit C
MGFVGQVLEGLGDAVTEVHQCEPRRGIARIDPARTVEVAEKLIAVESSRLATATGIDVRDGIDVLYHWCFEPQGVVVTIKVLAVRPGLTVDSIANVVPGANWIEREMHDLLGANFRNHPDMRRLILDDSWPEGVHPLRKDFDQILDRPPLPPAPSPPEAAAEQDEGRGRR